MSFLAVLTSIFSLYIVAGAVGELFTWRRRIREADAERVGEVRRQRQLADAARSAPPVVLVQAAPKKKKKKKEQAQAPVTRKDLLNDDPF